MNTTWYKIIVLVSLFSGSLFAQGGWILQESGTTTNLRSISTFDGVNVLAVGEGGIILLSTNYGIGWTELNSPTKKNLNGVAALSGRDYCIVGPKDTIYYTNDRGITWHAAKSNARGECATRNAINELTAIDYDSVTHTLCAVGNQGEAVFSADSGKNWLENSALSSPLSGPLATNLTSISLHNGLSLTAGRTVVVPGITIDHYDFFYLSANFGDNWIEHSLERYQSLFGDITLNMYGCDLEGWTMVGGWGVFGSDGGGTIFHSVTKGATWDSIPLGGIPVLHSVSFGNNIYGYLCGDNGFIMTSNDGGYNWKQQISPSRQKLRSIHFSDAFHGFICGDSGVIITTQDGGFNLGVQPNSRYGVSLQIYPNPSSKQTTILIDLPERGLAKLRIYNLLGMQVAELENNILEAGPYRFDWNSDETANGVYICRLELNGKIVTSSLSIVK